MSTGLTSSRSCAPAATQTASWSPTITPPTWTGCMSAGVRQGPLPPISFHQRSPRLVLWVASGFALVEHRGYAGVGGREVRRPVGLGTGGEDGCDLGPGPRPVIAVELM